MNKDNYINTNKPIEQTGMIKVLFLNLPLISQ